MSFLLFSHKAQHLSPGISVCSSLPFQSKSSLWIHTQHAQQSLILLSLQCTQLIGQTHLQAYLRAWSRIAFALPALLALLAAVERIAQVAQNWWLSVWTDATVAAESRSTRLDARPYVAVYFVLGGIAVILQASPHLPQLSFIKAGKDSLPACGLARSRRRPASLPVGVLED